jgi:CO/xanthine dehydrogenase FAD-binding subunit
VIGFDFEYYKPGSIEEAVRTFAHLDAEGRNPFYYGGGTEIITMARMNNVVPGAVIDLKGIPECRALGHGDGRLIIGAGATLAEIHESGLFPLLGRAGGRVADHSVQVKVTLGGNLAGTIVYREASLPLLVADCEAVVAGAGGLRVVPFQDVFGGRLNLPRGDFLVQVNIARESTCLPGFHAKKTRLEKIGYPVLAAVMVRDRQGRYRAAFSGLCSSPFRSVELEAALNDARLEPIRRIDLAIASLPAPVLDDTEASAGYRLFVLRNTLEEALDALGGVA